jgi:hypothetical protein
MSVVIHHTEPGSWTMSANRQAVCIGTPLRGAEALGPVISFTTGNRDGAPSWIRTTTNCPGTIPSGKRHMTTHYIDDAALPNLRCTRCDLTVAPEPPFAFGVTLIDRADGTTSVTTAPYDDNRHGPLGGTTESDARALGEHLVELREECMGPGPWTAVHYAAGDDERRVNVFTLGYAGMISAEEILTSSRAAGILLSYRGPFANRRDAMIERYRAYEFFKTHYDLTPPGWTMR